MVRFEERRCFAYADLAFFDVANDACAMEFSFFLRRLRHNRKTPRSCSGTENANLGEMPLWRRRDRKDENSKSRRRSHTAFRQFCVSRKRSAFKRHKGFRQILRMRSICVLKSGTIHKKESK